MAPMFQRLFAAEEEAERPKAAEEGHEQGVQAATARDAAAAEVPPVATTTVEAAAHQSSDSGPGGSPEELIHASKLPPAADVLAQLFAETAPVEESPAVAVVQPEKTPEL